MYRYLIINGPNLNLLGVREKDLYGKRTLDEILIKTQNEIKKLNNSIVLDSFQSNFENEIVDKIQKAGNDYDGIIINPGAYAHTSIAILDAMKILKIPIVEVHLTNLYKREYFRQVLLTAQAATTIISGPSDIVYYLGACALLNIEREKYVQNN